MNKLGLLCTSWLVACGGSARAPVRQPVAVTPTVRAEAVTPPVAPVEVVAAPEPAPAPEPVVLDPLPPVTAVANLVATADGAAIGRITFEQHGASIVMDGSFQGLPPGLHGFYIHERGDCTRKARFTGKHLDPTKAKHGAAAASNRHAGDLGDLSVDRAGNGRFQMTTDSVLLEPGRSESILQRSIVVHARKDDRRGDAGAPIACGVIELVVPGVAVTP